MGNNEQHAWGAMLLPYFLNHNHSVIGILFGLYDQIDV